MTEYKILVLDIDGTLTKKDKTISEHTRKTLILAQEKGIKIVLASGRPVYGIAPLADELQMDKYHGYILAYNGGAIIDWSDKKQIYSNMLPDDVIPYLYKCAKDNNFEILSYSGKDIVTEDTSNKYVAYEAMLNKMPCRQVDNFLDEIKYEIPKCLIVGDPEPLHELEKKMALELDGKINVFRSEPFFMELVPLGIDKAKCLEKLNTMIGVRRKEMIACGDGFNDMSMVEYAGLGVAMSNAQDKVKAVADYITLSNEEDGVAHVVEKFILNNEA